MSEIKHTPGPWRWEINRHAKQVQLCGGDGTRRGVGGLYDCPVMTFKRYGRNGAAPVFWEWDTDRGLAKSEPSRADKLAVEVAGREHHADWFAEIDHANARLIAAAPELLDELRETAFDLSLVARSAKGAAKTDSRWDGVYETLMERVHKAEALIAKAEGRS